MQTWYLTPKCHREHHQVGHRHSECHFPFASNGMFFKSEVPIKSAVNAFTGTTLIIQRLPLIALTGKRNKYTPVLFQRYSNGRTYRTGLFAHTGYSIMQGWASKFNTVAVFFKTTVSHAMRTTMLIIAINSSLKIITDIFQCFHLPRHYFV